jgi:hypothetical protein
MFFCQLYAKDDFRGELVMKLRNRLYYEGVGPELGQSEQLLGLAAF